MVSIILPFFNRAKFLLEAIAAIREQRYKEWELIGIDDGSTDDSSQRFEEATTELKQPVMLLRQENAGAYAARAHGLRHASGEIIAVYDSDDLWLPHHLSDCVTALAENPDVDWVYGANRRIDAATGAVVAENSFYEEGRKAFLDLHVDRRGDLRVIDDPDIVCCALRHGLYAGLQLSAIRRRVFEQVPFRGDLRNGEDRFFGIRAAKLGCRFAYFDNVHQVYRIHGDNSSAVGSKALAKQLAVYEILRRGYEDLKEELDLTQCEKRALHERLASQCFWQVGYSLLWANHRYDEALEAFRTGLRYAPGDWRMRKTYWVAKLKRSFLRSRSAA